MILLWGLLDSLEAQADLDPKQPLLLEELRFSALRKDGKVDQDTPIGSTTKTFEIF